MDKMDNNIFTYLELKCLCSLINKDDLFGLNLRFKILEDTSFEDIKKSLISKKILLDDDITNYGMLMIELLRYYDDSEFHLEFNNLFISFNSNEDYLTIIKDKNNRMELCRFSKKKFLNQVIKNNSFYHSDSREYPKMVYKVSDKMEFTKDYTGFFTIKVFHKNTLIKHKLLCTNDTNGSIYNFKDSTLVKVGPIDLKQELFNLFEMREL
ncbi:MAG: DUF5081 family protein [Erysipelotrichaceae bacterium]